MKEAVRLAPAFKDYLWGGTKLKTEFNKKSGLDKVAESWELSTHPDGCSTVVSGEFAGMSLPEYLSRTGSAGRKAENFEFFPILIKFIDAKDNLSIQVHPSDEYALKNENSFGKTEMWYILSCEENAFLYYGFSRCITKEEYRERIENNTITEVLNKVYVKKGDVFFIPSGTVHAIGKGIVICEIQQNSNLTYRVYDYDRRGKDGKPRELHIEKAIEVSELKPAEPCESKEENVLASCSYFTAEKHNVSGEITLCCDPECFRSIIVTEGSGSLTLGGASLSLVKGDSIFIPAQEGSFTVSGSCEIIMSYV
ncbi:MAG: class I mannose-6-phosphate isomerase [Clostridia bacterium]|nr:class I mannose-6-phosphate isomerase [Clostridia bacterium]